MKNGVRFLVAMFSWMSFYTIAHAQMDFMTVDQSVNRIYGAQTGCTQVTMTTAGTQYRTAALGRGLTYKIYGYNSSTNAGETIVCAMGGSSVDVTNLASSQVGSKIFASAPEAWTVKGTNLYISCTATDSGMKFDTCLLR